jgi:hypothetical protein
MKRILLTFTMTLFSAMMSQAQSELIPNNLPLRPLRPPQLISTRVEPVQQESQRVLPDAPIPVLPNLQDGPLPCPAGVGRPCALLGGRLYFRDPVHMTEHDKSWADAMKNKGMLLGMAVNAAAAVWDYKTTRHCIDTHRGSEGNPLMGQSQAQELSVGIGLTALTYFMAGKLKKQGDGNYAFGALWGGTILHVFAGAHSWSVCHG